MSGVGDTVPVIGPGLLSGGCWHDRQRPSPSPVVRLNRKPAGKDLICRAGRAFLAF